MNLKSLVKKQPKKPPRVLIYSIAGWGKSTLAASMPNPVFLDLEEGLSGLEAMSFPVPKDYDDFESQLGMLIKEDHKYKTVVIDTLSALEKLIFAKVCKEKDKNSIEDFGFARGYVFALKYWDKIIEGMNLLRAKGIAPVFLAHSEIKTINDPLKDPYDQYILRLHKHPAAAVTQWSDLLLFGTHRVTVKQSGEGLAQKGKGIGQGERVVYTETRPAFLAKSRMDLKFEIDVPKENGWAAIINNKVETNVIKEKAA